MAKKTGNLEVKSKGANINPYHMTSQNWFIYIFLRISQREFWTAQRSDVQVIGVTGNWEVGLLTENPFIIYLFGNHKF